MKKVPEGKAPGVYAGEVEQRASRQMNEDAGTSHDGCRCWVLKSDEFDEQWEAQENLKNTEEIKEKYRQLTSEGQVIVLEMDW